MDVVIYHANCNDGFCAAWLCHKVWPDAEYVPMHYGADPSDVTGKNVIITDFSFKRPVMHEICAKARSVVVLDHHKTAEGELALLDDDHDNLFLAFDMDKSGGRLIWEYLCLAVEGFPGNVSTWWLRKGYSKANPPWLVNYTEDRDLWRWAWVHSREINAALRSYPLEFGVWDRLNGTKLDRLCEEGAAILRYQQTVIDAHVRNAKEVGILGCTVLCCNATTMFSEVAGELAKNRPFGAVHFDRPDGKRQWSLRSTNDGLDVAEIARQFGGGGHRNAAGFEGDIT